MLFYRVYIYNDVCALWQKVLPDDMMVQNPHKVVVRTVKPRPEAHMDMILFEVFLKNIHLIPQDQIVQWLYLYY